nr:hemicentin-2-like isoform X8 [Biomphalaria glabrata]
MVVFNVCKASSQKSTLLTLTIGKDDGEEGAAVDENETYNATCTATTLSHVTLSCGNITELMQVGYSLTAAVVFTRNTTGTDCSCTAHDGKGSGDVQLVSKRITVRYAASITSFATDKSHIIDNGTWGGLYCEAVGYPLPRIALWKDNNILKENPSGSSLSFRQLMSCTDTGAYHCHAENGISNINSTEVIHTRTIHLYVRCSLQFSSTGSVLKFTHKPGETFISTFTLMGWPEPSEFSVLKSGQVENRLSVHYSVEKLPHGKVDLKIEELQTSDFSKHTVVIFQQGSPLLTYNFVIEEESSRPSVSVIAGAVVGSVFIVTTLLVIVRLSMSICCKRKKTISDPAIEEPGRENGSHLASESSYIPSESSYNATESDYIPSESSYNASECDSIPSESSFLSPETPYITFENEISRL